MTSAGEKCVRWKRWSSKGGDKYEMVESRRREVQRKLTRRARWSNKAGELGEMVEPSRREGRDD